MKKNKTPYFPFYVGDWLGGTLLMNRHQKGCYIDVLVAQFNAGHLSLAQIQGLLGPDFDAWDSVLCYKFIQDDKGLYYNEKLESVILERTAFSKSQSERALKRWKEAEQTLAAPKRDAEVIPDEYQNDAETMLSSSSSSSSSSSNSKKKSTPKKRFSADLSFIPPEWKEVFIKWLKYKRQKNSMYRSQESLEAALRNMQALSGGDIETADKIVDQTMANNYQGLTPLKFSPSMPTADKFKPQPNRKYY